MPRGATSGSAWRLTATLPWFVPRRISRARRRSCAAADPGAGPGPGAAPGPGAGPRSVAAAGRPCGVPGAAAC
ncbi:hypothetical protein NKH77_27135 [Streptomyces sp. M19]